MYPVLCFIEWKIFLVFSFFARVNKMFSNWTVDCRWGNTLTHTHLLTHSQHQESHDNKNEMHQQYKKATIMTWVNSMKSEQNLHWNYNDLNVTVELQRTKNIDGLNTIKIKVTGWIGMDLKIVRFYA